MKLLKGQYGLKQSAGLFSRALQNHMFGDGMKSPTNDPCLFKGSFSRARLYLELGKPKKYASFVAENPKKMEHMMVGTWVDDLTKIGSCDLILDWFIMHLRKKFAINEKGTGDLFSTRILGVCPPTVLHANTHGASYRRR